MNASNWGRIIRGFRFLKRKRLIAVLALLSMGAGVVPQPTSQVPSILDYEDVAPVDSPRVRVRVLAEQKQLSLEGESFKIGDLPLKLEHPIGFLRRGQLVIWKSGPRILTQQPLEQALLISGRKLIINGHSVPRQLRLLARNDGTIDVLAEMPLEKYIEGVLAGEMPSNWPIESLKAQAVAARSYFLALKQAPKHKNFDIDSSQFDQVYKAVEALPASAREQIRRAVNESQGLVLRLGQEYPLQAYFHADCGGVTEKASSVWGGGKAKKLAGPRCPLNPGHQWKYEIKKKTLARLLGLKALARLAPQELSESGRVVTVNARSSTGHVEVVTAARLRKLLGYTQMKSTLFEIYEQDDTIEFRGRGFGHGVGLCQWGSKHMAETGKSFVDILGHYYPNSRVVPVSRGSRQARLSR